MTKAELATRGANILRCEQVSKSFGGVRALQGVTLAVAPSEILGLVGPNGAGKTTLIDILGGEQEPDTGSVTMDGRPLRGRPTARARLGLARTFQRPLVAHDLTVAENVALGFAVRRARSLGRLLAETALGVLQPRLADAESDAIAQACAGLGLADLDRPVSDLSFGEVRLVEIGRALMQRPRVILLDEPFQGVDDAGVEGIVHALNEILRLGCGVLLVDHNVDIVAAVVHRIALMDKGQVLFDGDPRACLDNPLMQSVYFGDAPVAAAPSSTA